MTDFIMPDVIRRSHIELYKKCAHSFYLSAKDGNLRASNDEESEDDGESIYALLGRDLHELFDKACNDRSYMMSEMLDAFHRIWDNYSPSLFKDDEFKNKMYDRAVACIDTFYNTLPSLPIKPFMTEQQIIFQIEEGLPSVSITMDRIDEVDGMLEIHDWKTGKVMVGKKFASDLQAPLYIYAIEKHYGKKVRSFTFHYLNESKTRVFERVDDDKFQVKVLKNVYTVSLLETIREVKSLFSRIKNHDFNIPHDVKSMYFTCKMCPHRDVRCQGAEVQSWNNVYNRGE